MISDGKIPVGSSTAALVVTYSDRADLCEQVLQRVLNNGVSKIILVENGVSDCAERRYQALEQSGMPLCRVSLCENAGSALGFKTGIEFFLSRTALPYLWILDDDNLPCEHALSTLHDARVKITQAGLSADPVLHCNRGASRQADLTALHTGTPKSLVANDFMGFSASRWLTSLFQKDVQHRESSPEGWVEIHCGSYGGLFTSRQNFKKNGLPRSDFVLYADDTEYTYRFHQQGIRQFLVGKAQVTDLVPTFEAGNDYFSESMSPVKIFFSIRNHVFLSKGQRNCKLVYNLNKATLLSMLLCKGMRHALRAPSFAITRMKLVLLAMQHGDSGNFNVETLDSFYERWNRDA